MGGVEASGKTVEEAIEKALGELGADRDEVDVEVLSEGKGLLGVGGQARVRVTLIADDEPQPGNEAEPDESDAPPGPDFPERCHRRGQHTVAGPTAPIYGVR